ncbi:MAG: hypothetical protein IRZ05_06030 [Micromonosporaceae bacterium]|nr:hypothetical protein [Micromonosporaceae bacterium]
MRAVVGALAVAAVVSVATACGEPQFTYVKNSAEKTYFKVPHEWHKIGASELDDVLLAAPSESATADLQRDRSWNTAYDAADRPSAAHLLSGQTTDDPIVYAQVLQLDEATQGEISLDWLRNVFLPVTPEENRKAAAELLGLGFFELVHDEVLTPSDNIHGVRVIYNYQLPSGVLHTFDLTALVNNGADRVYALLIRCSTRCYKDRADELNTIATSFTVRSRS